MIVLIRRSGARGSVLAMALAFMFVLLTVVIAMHTSQARAMRTVTQAEAELHFRQAAEFSADELLHGGNRSSAEVRVRADHRLIADHQTTEKYAEKLWDGLPDWMPREGEEFAPGHRTHKLSPETHDQALNVFADKFLWLVTRDSGGYAVYAPNGKVKLESGVGWANPSLDDQRASAQAYSGVPVLIAGKGKVELQTLSYGSVYSLEGPIDLGQDKSSLALAFQGSFPMRAYQTTLKTSLQNARSEMEAVAATGDKTSDITGPVFSGSSVLLNLLRTRDTGTLPFRLQQAMSFPFPVIPSYSTKAGGFVHDVWFHVPYPPDLTASLGTPNPQEESELRAVEKLDTEIQQLEANISALVKQQSTTVDQTEKEKLQVQLEHLRRTLEDKNSERSAILRQIQDAGRSSVRDVERQLTDPQAPVTRSQDRNIPDTGQKGWNYSRMLGGVFSFLLNMATFDFEALQGQLSGLGADVRLVHFGGEHNEPDFRFRDGFFAKSSWTVPPGRSFKFHGKMTVVGDLWLQKGTVMHVTGDLVLQNPDPSASEPLKPSGKLVLEEGATLIVGGDLRVAGDPRFGSLWVCSPPGKLSSVSSAIFVGGSCRLPYGSFSAMNFEDAVRSLQGQESLADGFERFFTEGAPNLGKIDGAFHERQPYFASYATTFKVVIVGLTPVVFSPSQPKENLLVPLFRVFSHVYTSRTNAALGDNTYLHADWWTLGEGVVPALLKIDPKAMTAFQGLSATQFKSQVNWERELDSFANQVLRDGADFAVKSIGFSIVAALLESATPGGGQGAISLSDLPRLLADRLKVSQDVRLRLVQEATGSAQRAFPQMDTRVSNDVKLNLKESYLREVSGPLIYAGSIQVGEPSSPSSLMAGMLVAEGDIIVNAGTFVGSLTSFQGNVTAEKLYYTPAFTRASLYKPKAVSAQFLERFKDRRYGKDLAGGGAVDIKTGVGSITTEAWNR